MRLIVNVGLCTFLSQFIFLKLSLFHFSASTPAVPGVPNISALGACTNENYSLIDATFEIGEFGWLQGAGQETPIFALVVTTAVLALTWGVLYARSPAKNLLNLIAVFAVAILVLLSFEVEFAAYIFLIIYVGAVAILFLFVIMLLNIHDLARPGQVRTIAVLECGVVIVLGARLLQLFTNRVQTLVFLQQYTASIGNVQRTMLQASGDFTSFTALYLEHSYLLILLGMILLMALLGALLLAAEPPTTTTKL